MPDNKPTTYSGGEDSSRTPQSAPAIAGGRERRRSDRIPYYNPLVVTWIRGDGVRVHEYAGAADVSAHGCLLKMTTPVPLHALIEIRHPRHKSHVRGRVVRLLPPGDDGLLRIGVDLDTPGMVFWLLESIDDEGLQPTPLQDELLGTSNL